MLWRLPPFLLQVPKADVVLASYEHVMTDLEVLRVVPWEAVIVDLRMRARGVTPRATASLAELGGSARVLVLGPAPFVAPLEDVAGIASFVLNKQVWLW